MAAPNVYLVTGASRGIGLSAVRYLLSHPSSPNVVAMSRSTPPELEELAGKYKGSLIISQGDISKEHDMEEAINLALRAWSKIDGLVLNAATLDPFARISDMTISLDEWRKAFDVNVFSLITALKFSIPSLRQTKGRVIFVSSGAATGNTAGWGAYNSTKAAMNSICRTLAAEERDITCVAFRPGTVATDMQAEIRARGEAHMSPGDFKKFQLLHSENKLLDPSIPGYIISNLLMRAPLSLSGLFLSWDSEELKDYRP